MSYSRIGGLGNLKILFVCQHYWPEPFNSTDVCETLISRGHQVTVITGLPNVGMPNCEIPERYSGRHVVEEERSGVCILRASLTPRKEGAKNRIKNYITFWRNANKLALSISEEFDVVLGYQLSPVMQVDPGIKFSEKTKTPFLLYSFDLWPESLVVGGFSKKSIPFKWMKVVSKRIYSSADTLAVTSPLFTEYFKNELGMNNVKTVYIPQYAEDVFGENPEIKPSGYDSSKINISFAGNVGKAQSIETIIGAAHILRNDDRFIFHIVGGGSSLAKCQDLAVSQNLSNIIFHGSHLLEEMPLFYGASDAMLITFANNPIIGYTLPRKVQSYMAAGKPVLGAVVGETKRVIEDAGCGFCCNAEDSEGLARICYEFAEKSEKYRKNLGEKARIYYEEHFSKDKFFETLELELEKLKGTEHGD